jgi:transcriptional regulator with XRE-family HTH domain
MYHAIERGHRKPNADTLFLLAAVYKTSMDFVYHAFCRQHIIWNFPDYDLQYALKQAKAIDIAYLRERIAPEPPPPLPKMPAAFIYERTDGSDPDYPAPKLYGQSQSPSE